MPTSQQATVLHIHFWADIRNSAGSVEKVITAFASHGQAYRHEIACCPTEPDVPQTFEHHGVTVHAFRESRLINRIFNKMLRLNAFTFSDLIRLINRLQPAILHFHNRQELVDSIIRRLNYRPAVLVHYHRHFAFPVIPALADRLLFISQRTADDILGKTGTNKPSDIVFNPLSLEILEHQKKRFRAVPTKGLPTILFGGGGNPIKGGKELVEAFASLPKGSARLILAGRNVEGLPGLLQDGIEVLGEVPAEKFFDLMLSADIVTMPSYDEPFGLIAQEAMLLRKLLVLSGSGGLLEFTGEDCAVIVQPRSVASLKDGLLRAIALLSEAEVAKLSVMLDCATARVDAFRPSNVSSRLEKVYDLARGIERI